MCITNYLQRSIYKVSLLAANVVDNLGSAVGTAEEQRLTEPAGGSRAESPTRARVVLKSVNTPGLETVQTAG